MIVVSSWLLLLVYLPVIFPFLQSNWEQPREDTALNYKKLYEDAMLEVKKLQVQLFNTQQKLAETEAVKKEYEQVLPNNHGIVYNVISIDAPSRESNQNTK